MAEFLTTQGTTYHIEQIMINANNWLILISPYLQLSQNFYVRLSDAGRRGVKTAIVYGKDELKPTERVRLEQLPNLTLLFCNNLHGKCYVNQEAVVISSMNMYEYSEHKNREMGILIRKSLPEDAKLYSDVLREVNSIMHASIKPPILAGHRRPKRSAPAHPDIQQPLDNQSPRQASGKLSGEPSTPVQSALRKAVPTFYSFFDALRTAAAKITTDVSHDNSQGNCIRCGSSIPWDPSRPYCLACYTSWAEWRNAAHIEKLCHSCGRTDRSSMLYPQCPSCFQKSQER